jgi:hypothetical protein
MPKGCSQIGRDATFGFGLSAKASSTGRLPAEAVDIRPSGVVMLRVG